MEVSGQHHALATLQPRNNPGTRWIGGWVGPGARLEFEQKNLFTLSRLEPRTVHVSPEPSASFWRLQCLWIGVWRIKFVAVDIFHNAIATTQDLERRVQMVSVIIWGILEGMVNILGGSMDYSE
jgi:hypothetical protein